MLHCAAETQHLASSFARRTTDCMYEVRCKQLIADGSCLGSLQVTGSALVVQIPDVDGRSHQTCVDIVSTAQQ